MKHTTQMTAAALCLGTGALLALSTPACADTIYVSSYVGHTIMKYTSDGVGSVFATTSGGPGGLALDGQGNLYVAMSIQNLIMKFTPDGVGSVFATNGLSWPSGLAFDGKGNLYAANFANNSVTKITPDGISSIYVSAGLGEPYALTFDTAGNLYVSNDGVYHGGVYGTIVKVTPTGSRSVFATGLGNPQGLAFDANGNLFVPTMLNSSFNIMQITPAGAVSLFAENDSGGPVGLSFDSAGDLYAANANDNTVVRFSPDGVRSVFASTGLNDPIDIAIQVPEPAVGALLGVSTVLLLVSRRRKQPASGPRALLKREHEIKTR